MHHVKRTSDGPPIDHFWLHPIVLKRLFFDSSFRAVSLKVWVAEGQKTGRAKVIQIRQKDFLQDKNIYDLQNLFLLLIKSFNSTITELLHHTHLFRLHLDKIG